MSKEFNCRIFPLIKRNSNSRLHILLIFSFICINYSFRFDEKKKKKGEMLNFVLLGKSVIGEKYGRQKLMESGGRGVEGEFCKLSSWEWKFRANVQSGWVKFGALGSMKQGCLY